MGQIQPQKYRPKKSVVASIKKAGMKNTSSLWEASEAMSPDSGVSMKNILNGMTLLSG